MSDLTPEQVAAMIAPRPLGGKWDVLYAPADPAAGTEAQVIVRIEDAAGVAVRFLAPDVALQVAHMLRENAREAKGARLILPPNGLVDGQGGLL